MVVISNNFFIQCSNVKHIFYVAVHVFASGSTVGIPHAMGVVWALK